MTDSNAIMLRARARRLPRRPRTYGGPSRVRRGGDKTVSDGGDRHVRLEGRERNVAEEFEGRTHEDKSCIQRILSDLNRMHRGAARLTNVDADKLSADCLAALGSCMIRVQRSSRR